MKTQLLLLAMSMCLFTYGQNWNGSTASTTTSDWNTSIQLTSTGWGAQHGVLFNSYRSSTLVDGPLSSLGNTKYMFNDGGYGNGAGAIMFLGNGGRMDFLISGISSGPNQNVDWQIPKMSIYRNGNVGIGVIGDPDQKLTVNGKIKCEEIQVVVDVADYVFADNYDLKKLSEVEDYIRINKHLPGIPGKNEVDEKGYDVGKMSNKMLEKIEELTLYMIELKKENEVLKKENAAFSELSTNLKASMEELRSLINNK